MSVRLKSERGFTMLEVIISVGIFGVVSLAAFSVLSSSKQFSVMNDQTVQIHKNIRLAMDLIVRDVRMTGYGNPAANSLSASQNGVNCPQQLNATDSGSGAVGSDSISIMTVDQQVGTLDPTIANTYPPLGITTTNQITIQGLSAGSVFNNDVLSLGGAFTFKTSGCPASGCANPVSITPNIQNPAVFASGTPVVRLTCVTYTVTGAGATPPFQLMRNGAAIVDGIESIQFAYGVDADGNGIIDDQAGRLPAPAPDCLDFIPNNVVLPNSNGCTVAGAVPSIAVLPYSAAINASPTYVRQIRITVVGRAIPPAAVNVANNCWYDATYTGSAVVNAENQTLLQPVQPAACPGPLVTGGIRRRSLTRIVSLRNTGT